MTYDYSVYYRRFHDDSEAHAVQMSEWLWSYLKADMPNEVSTPVLDVGCGFGFALRAMRTAGYTNVQGIEVSEQQAVVARKAGFDVPVVEDSRCYLQQHSSRFGVVLLLDVLEHIPVSAQIELVRAIKEALQPGGRLIVTVPNANSPLAARWRYNDHTHSSSFTEHSLFFVLSNAGFGEIKMDNSKGLGGLPRRWWKCEQRNALRKWLVRFAWSQVFKAELHSSEKLNDICFELNLKAIAFNNLAALSCPT